MEIHGESPVIHSYLVKKLSSVKDGDGTRGVDVDQKNGSVGSSIAKAVDLACGVPMLWICCGGPSCQSGARAVCYPLNGQG